MKGAGEGFFEMDFLPGSDMMGQIMNGPRAAERMEFELFTRINAQGTRSRGKGGLPSNVYLDQPVTS